jgi:hypothetical protein
MLGLLSIEKFTFMRSLIVILLLLAACSQSPSVTSAAAEYVPGVRWQPNSVVNEDLSCRGAKEQAILGANSTEIVIAVFLHGLNQRPEVLRYSAEIRDAATAALTVEDQDYDPKDEVGADLPGFKRSQTCKGLNVSDGKIDSAHIYWNHDAQRFEDWVR